MDTFWIWQSFCMDCVYFILQRSGCRPRSVHLKHAYLSVLICWTTNWRQGNNLFLTTDRSSNNTQVIKPCHKLSSMGARCDPQFLDYVNKPVDFELHIICEEEPSNKLYQGVLMYLPNHGTNKLIARLRTLPQPFTEQHAYDIRKFVITIMLQVSCALIYIWHAHVERKTTTCKRDLRWSTLRPVINNQIVIHSPLVDYLVHKFPARMKQPVHSFLGGKSLGIQQGKGLGI